MEVEALNLIIGDASYEDGEELNSTGTAIGIAVGVEWRNDDDDDDTDDDGFVGDDDDDDDDDDSTNGPQCKPGQQEVPGGGGVPYR